MTLILGERHKVAYEPGIGVSHLVLTKINHWWYDKNDKKRVICEVATRTGTKFRGSVAPHGPNFNDTFPNDLFDTIAYPFAIVNIGYSDTKPSPSNLYPCLYFLDSSFSNIDCFILTVNGYELANADLSQLTVKKET